MPATGYTVASAATLLGARPPRRREIEDVYFEEMAATDRKNREQSQLQRTADVKRKEGAKKVRFQPTPTPSDAPDGLGSRTRTFAEWKALVREEEERAVADMIQAEEVVSRAGVTGVTTATISTTGKERSLPSRTNREVDNDDDEEEGKVHDGPSRETSGRRTDQREPRSRDAKSWGGDKDSVAGRPLAPSHRSKAKRAEIPVGQYTRIDTSGSRNDDNTARSSTSAAAATAGAAYTASHHASAKGTGKERAADDIFFTPVDVNRSTIEFEFFNAPMSAPRVLGSSDEGSFERGESSSTNTTPLFRNRGKQSFDRYQHARRRSYDGRPRRRRSSAAKAKRDKITLSSEQLDRLVVALANAPLVHSHLRKQWLEEETGEQKGNPSLLSLRSALRQTEPTDSTPSLTNNSTASDEASDSSSALYSHANTTFLHDSATSLPKGDEQDVNEHHLVRTRPRARFGGIALTDPKVHGAPIRFVSKGYKKGANCLQVGQCSFLNVPYGASADCILRIEPGDVANGGAACSVTIQVMAQVLERRKGRKVYLLVAEVDVTESLTKAVLVEFSRHTGMSLEDIEIVQPEPVRRDSVRESIDWCALADELQASWSTNEIIENAAAAFKNIDAETCTMQTLTLLSELERIKAQHVDFLVLRANGAHANGSPTGISVPWISQHLDHHVNLWSPEASSLFREDLVAAVGRRHVDGEPFAVRALWGRKKKIVRCVPLLEGECGKTAAWCCFVGDEFDV